MYVLGTVQSIINWEMKAQSRKRAFVSKLQNRIPSNAVPT